MYNIICDLYIVYIHFNIIFIVIYFFRP